MATATTKTRNSPEEEERLCRELVKLYEGGATVREIADKYGRAYSWAHSRLTRSGVTFRIPGYPPKNGEKYPTPDHLADAIAEKIRKGVYRVGEMLPPLKELTREYGVTIPRARRAITLLCERGLTRRRTSVGTVVIAVIARRANPT